MEFSVDWNAVCLVCLQEGDMRSIYEKDDKDEQICDKIMRCSNIEIKKGMNLPEQICDPCVNDLNAAYRFRMNCENSNVILKSFIDSRVTDVEIPAGNGQIYKYKPPSGLNVKRIKCSPTTKMIKVKEEQIIIEDENETHYHENSLDGLNQTTTTEEYVYETGTFQEEDDDVNEHDDHDDRDDDDDDDGINDNCITAASAIDDDEDSNQPLSIYKSATYKNVKKEKITKNEEEETENAIIFKNVEAVEESFQEDSSIKTTTKMANKRGPRGIRARVQKPKLVTEITRENISSMVSHLTSVAYIRKFPEDEKPLKICEICGNGYKYQHALDSHMRRHRNEKPFQCEFCERAFVANVELRRHMRVHTGQKPYACRYCDRRFSDFGSRIKHERTHTGERPYKCTTCGKAFAYAHVLSVHVLTHTGEKRFKCNICGKGFTKKVYLQSHMNHHSTDQSIGISANVQQQQGEQSQGQIFVIKQESDGALAAIVEQDVEITIEDYKPISFPTTNT